MVRKKVAQGINDFAPDYEYWWSKPDLNEEELSALVFGINPRALEHFLEIESRSKNPEEREFKDYFQHFARKLPYEDFLGINGFRADLLTRKDYWAGKQPKLNYVKKLYEDGFRYLGSEMHPDLLEFLKTKPECAKFIKFEKYKSHEIYKADFANVDVAEISNSESAAAILLGLDLGCLQRYIKIKQEMQKEPEEHGYLRLAGEDKFFFREYRVFISQYYAHAFFSADLAVTKSTFPELVKIKFESFEQFALAAYNDGFLFRDSVTTFLAENAIKLKYNPDSWVIQNYKYFAKEPLWTVEQAFNLFKGIFRFDGSHSKRNDSIADLREDNSLFTYHGNDYAWAWDSDIGELVNIMPRLEKACKANELDFVDDGGVRSFKPRVIIEWLRENTEYTPPVALYFALTNSDKKEPSFESADAQKSKSAKIKKQKQAKLDLTELIAAINNVGDNISKRLDKLNYSMEYIIQQNVFASERKVDNRKPSQADKRLPDLEKLINIIQEIDTSLSSKKLPQKKENFIKLCQMLVSCQYLNDDSEYTKLFKELEIKFVQGRGKNEDFWIKFKIEHEDTIKNLLAKG